MYDHDEFVLFIDETGTASLQDTYSQYYILAGCAVLERERVRLKNWADHIKFKYWGRTNIVFHSKEIGRKENNFSIFKNPKQYSNFLTDLEELLTMHEFYMFYTLVDKQAARAKNWNDIKIYNATSDSIIKNFVCFLLSQKAKGKIVVESATTQKDFYFHKALGSYLGNGISGTGISNKQVKETLTSISFVTKNNFDTEEQIADLFTYAAKCYHLKKSGLKYRQGAYEKMLLNIFSKKLTTKARIKNLQNPKHLKHLNSFEICT